MYLYGGDHGLLKGLCHGNKCLHLFSYSEGYHEQMGPIPSSNRYSPIQCAYLEPSAFQTVGATELASRYEINTELLVLAWISRLAH